MSELTVNIHAIICINMLLVLLLAGTSFAIIEDPYISRRDRIIMLIVCFLSLTVVMQGQLDYMASEGLIDTGDKLPFIRTLLGIYGYSVRPVLLVLFIALYGTGRTMWIYWTLTVLNAALYSTSLFGLAITFRIDENGIFCRGPLGYICFVLCFL